MKLKYDFCFQKYDDQYLAIADYPEDENKKKLLWIDDVGKDIMELLVNDLSFDELIFAIKNIYSGEDDVIKSGVNEFIKKLDEADLLNKDE